MLITQTTVDGAAWEKLAASGLLAGTVAVASAADPTAGVAAAMAQPVVQAAYDKWHATRLRRTTRALEAAAAQANLTADQVVERLANDPERLDLLAAALDAAARSALDGKVAALGRSLGALAADEAQIDTEYLWLRIFEDIDAPHVRVLQELLKDGREGPGHRRLLRPGDLEALIPSGGLALVVLQTLERHGLAIRPNPEELGIGTRAAYGVGPPTMQRVQGTWFMATRLADECLRRLQESDEGEPDPSA